MNSLNYSSGAEPPSGEALPFLRVPGEMWNQKA